MFTARYRLNIYIYIYIVALHMYFKLGRAMAQTVSRPPLSLEARDRFQSMLNLRCAKWQLDWFVTQYFCFPLSVSFHQCPTLIFIYMLLLPERQMGEAWGPSGNRGASDRNEI